MDAYIRFLNRFRWPLALLFSLLFCWSVLQAKHLKIKSDFKELLPPNFQSVKDLDRILSRVSGTSTLIVAIESDNQAASIRFANDLVMRLNEYPSDFISSVEYNVSELKTFFDANKYLYMELDDLKQLRDRLDRKIQREKLKRSGLYLDLESDEETGVLGTKDLEDKYNAKVGRYRGYTDGYLFGENGRLLAIVIKPPGSSTGVEFARKLTSRVRQTVNELEPARYDPTLKVGFTGKYQRVLFEYDALIDDMVSTALLCVSLVAFVVFVYFRRLRAVWLMAWAVFNGVAWTFAIASFTIGFLTTQTAFLGSIIVGNGVNYGLILMARYLEERRAGHNPLQALRIAFPATLPGTLASSVTTSVAFGILILAGIRGFSHFGFIGGVGMFLCWVATYTVLPVFMLISEQIWPLVKGASAQHRFSLFNPLAKNLERWTPRLNRTAVVLSLVSIPLILNYLPNALEYDFTKLRTKNKGQAASEEAVLNNRVKKIFGESMSPIVLVAERTDQVKPLCDEIMRKSKLDPNPKKQVVASCQSLYTYVPADQDEKIAVLGQIRQLLEDKSINFLKPEQKAEVERFKKEFTGKHIERRDLPEAVVSRFREKNGDEGKVVYVYPTDKAPISNGQNMILFADIISHNTLPGGEVITGSGEAAIFADLLRAVIRAGPIATVLAFLAVCLVVILIFPERRGIIFILGTLSLGVLWMAGAVAAAGVKINFLNFIAIPTTFGIGVDYGVNIYQRYKLEGRGSLPKVLKTTGGAVGLCSLTTIIGYYTLIIAKNQALVSFGWIAIIGELTCLAAALIFVPAIVTRWEKKHAR